MLQVAMSSDLCALTIAIKVPEPFFASWLCLSCTVASKIAGLLAYTACNVLWIMLTACPV